MSTQESAQDCFAVQVQCYSSLEFLAVLHLLPGRIAALQARVSASILFRPLSCFLSAFPVSSMYCPHDEICISEIL